jgi:8-oxo-dGTP pyrophosphatase MutT (NUDIX family)
MKRGVGAALVAVDKGKVLLVRRVHSDSAEEWWVPPGGALDNSDATPRACATSEVCEEAGLHPVSELLPARTNSLARPALRRHNQHRRMAAATVESVKTTAFWLKRDASQPVHRLIPQCETTTDGLSLWGAWTTRRESEGDACLGVPSPIWRCIIPQARILCGRSAA